MSSRLAYQYVALRCVPRVDREEFVNVGVVLYCHATDYLQSAWRVDPARLGAIDALVDPDQLRQALSYVDGVCDGADDSRLDHGGPGCVNDARGAHDHVDAASVDRRRGPRRRAPRLRRPLVDHLPVGRRAVVPGLDG